MVVVVCLSWFSHKKCCLKLQRNGGAFSLVYAAISLVPTENTSPTIVFHSRDAKSALSGGGFPTRCDRE